MSRNGRIDTDAADYFGGQRKTLAVADRRPVIRRASDLVGPGIGASATRITDFNDVLATYNGYYSYLFQSAGVSTTAKAPNTTESFIGYVIFDDELGGEQVFRGLTSRTQYVRTGVRNALDPSSITWSAWAASA